MKNTLIGILIITTMISGCRKFFDVELDKGKVTSDNVFATDENAVTAIRGIYQTLVSSAFGGGSNGIPALTGLSSDELRNHLREEQYLFYEENRLTEEDQTIESLWNSTYFIIYQANYMVEKLTDATLLSAGARAQLKGEALFIRSYCYLYLINLFGDVPLILGTNYAGNAKASRTGTAIIYQQIENDLKEAITLLKADYPESRKVRPNALAAASLLARVYLYQEKWSDAASQATTVIESGTYTLNVPLTGVFLMRSQETIWQLASESNRNTADASAYILTDGISTGQHGLSPGLSGSFEDGDQRWLSWVGIFVSEPSGNQLFFPFKYKIEHGATQEYYVMLRLAEQYLIRAEARAHMDMTADAIADVDGIRVRAGLPGFADINPSISKEELLLAIEQERRVELFSESAHRWFDLKRTGRASEVLKTKSSGGVWDRDMELYPLPRIEFIKNTALGSQNSGY